MSNNKPDGPSDAWLVMHYKVWGPGRWADPADRQSDVWQQRALQDRAPPRTPPLVPPNPQVDPCPRSDNHDWARCPYAHPKDKARRRDPRRVKYASLPCPSMLQVRLVCLTRAGFTLQRKEAVLRRQQPWLPAPGSGGSGGSGGGADAVGAATP
jgi:hypothetical protein